MTYSSLSLRNAPANGFWSAYAGLKGVLSLVLGWPTSRQKLSRLASTHERRK